MLFLGEAFYNESMTSISSKTQHYLTFELDYLWSLPGATPTPHTSMNFESCVAFKHSVIAADLTPCDVRVLVHSEEELSQTRTFERIFPRPDTEPYLDLMASNNYYDLLLAAWEQRHGLEDGGRGQEKKITKK